MGLTKTTEQPLSWKQKRAELEIRILQVGIARDVFACIALGCAIWWFLSEVLP